MSIPTLDWYGEFSKKEIVKRKRKAKQTEKTKINRNKQSPKLRVGTLSFDRLF